MGLKEWMVRAKVDVDQLQLTNDELSKQKVKEYRKKLRQNEEIEPPFVRVIPGEGYFVNDGNHRVTAAKKENIKSLLVDVYSVDD